MKTFQNTMSIRCDDGLSYTVNFNFADDVSELYHEFEVKSGHRDILLLCNGLIIKKGKCINDVYNYNKSIVAVSKKKMGHTSV